MKVISGSKIASIIVLFIRYIDLSYVAPRFDIIMIIIFENIIHISVVLFILVILYALLIVVIGFLLLFLLVYFKSHDGRLSNLLFTNSSNRCNRSLVSSVQAFLNLCVVVFLLLLGFLLNQLIIVVFVFDVATIVNLYWLGVYYRKCLLAVFLILALALPRPISLLMFFIC